MDNRHPVTRKTGTQPQLNKPSQATMLTLTQNQIKDLIEHGKYSFFL